MTFDGFPKETIEYLATLEKNNDKAWFDAHRAEYETCFLQPSVAFVSAIGPRLAKLDPQIHAEPRVNGSILRIHRDVRFSKDKSPYKNHIDLFFWSGDKKGWDNSGFFFRLTPNELMLGAGLHILVPPMLARFRKAVLDKRRGDALARIVAKLRKANLEVGEVGFKKVPRGVPEDHPRAELLKFSGLHAEWRGRHPKELFTPKFVEFAVKQFTAVADLHEWLQKM